MDFMLLENILSKDGKMHLRDDIYVYEWTDFTENNCNSYYIGGLAKVLVDPGLLQQVPDLLRRMEKDGIDPTEIQYILNTHAHPDHFEGSAYFYRSGIKIGLLEEEINYLKGPGQDLYALFGLAVPVLQINWPLKEGELLLGGDTFQIIHVPGHSPGSIALYSPSRDVLFSGDVVFEQSIGRTDFPGGDGPLLKNSIKKLAALEVDCLLPGHMGMVIGRDPVKKNFQMVTEYFFPYL